MRILFAILAVVAVAAPIVAGELYGGRACRLVAIGEIAILFGVGGWFLVDFLPKKEKAPKPKAPEPDPERHRRCLGCGTHFEEGDPRVPVNSGLDGSTDIGSCCLDCTAKLREWDAARKKEEGA